MNVEAVAESQSYVSQAAREISEMLPVGSKIMVRVDELSHPNHTIEGGVRVYTSGHFAFEYPMHTYIPEHVRRAIGYRKADSIVVAEGTVSNIGIERGTIEIVVERGGNYIADESGLYEIESASRHESQYGRYVDIIIGERIGESRYLKAYPERSVHLVTVRMGVLGIGKKVETVPVEIVPDSPWTQDIPFVC